MVWYFYQSQNKLQKKKGKIKQRGKRKKQKQPTYLGHPAQLTVSAAQPADSPCRLPRRGKQLAGAHADAGEHLLACLAPPEPSSHVLETLWSRPHPLPPSSSSFSSSCADFTAARRPPWSTPTRTRSLRHPQAVPPCPGEPQQAPSSFPSSNRARAPQQSTLSSPRARRNRDRISSISPPP